jgi:hypothetical protein
VLTSLLENPLSAQAHAGISVLSDLASDTQAGLALVTLFAGGSQNTD